METLVVLGGRDTQDRAEEGADDRDRCRDLRRVGERPNLTQPRVQRAEGGQDDDRQIFEYIIGGILESHDTTSMSNTSDLSLSTNELPFSAL